MNPIICPKCGSLNTSPGSLNQSVCDDCQTTFINDHREIITTTRQIILNTHQQGAASQNLTFTRTPTGATIEGPFLCYYPDLPEIYITTSQWQQLLTDFWRLNVLKWKSEYRADDDKKSVSAFGWDLKIVFDHQEPFTACGQSLYPPDWSALMELFTSLGLPNISKALGQNFLQLQTGSDI